MDTIDRLLCEVEHSILARGRNYLREGRVLSLERDGDLYLAEVEGSDYDPYQVQVVVEENGNVPHFSCDCPYEFGPVCKHLVAVFLAIEAEREQLQAPVSSKKAKSAPKQPPEISLPSVVGGMEPEALRALVLEWATAEPALRKQLLLSAGYYDQKAEQKEVKDRIRKALRKGGRDGYIGEYECDTICVELDNIIDLAEERRGKYPMAALDILLEVIKTGMKLASEADSSSGYLSDTLANATETLEALCQALAETGAARDKETCLQRLLTLTQDKCFDGWPENAYDMLRIAVLLVNRENAGKLTAVLDQLKSADPEDRYRHIHAENRLVRVLMLERLEGREAAQKELYADLSYDDARALAYQWACEAKHWAEAVRLCEEGVHGKTDWWSIPWLERMNTVHCRAGNRPGQEDTLERLLLAGQMEAYVGLKQMRLEDGTWAAHYPELRDKCAFRLPAHLYMKLLDREGEMALLMSMAERNPESVLQYGGRLAKEFPARTFPLYEKVIEAMSQAANKRKDYQRVCGALEALHKAGGRAEAAGLILRYAELHARKRAFQEELRILHAKLASARK